MAGGVVSAVTCGGAVAAADYGFVHVVDDFVDGILFGIIGGSVVGATVGGVSCGFIHVDDTNNNVRVGTKIGAIGGGVASVAIGVLTGIETYLKAGYRVIPLADAGMDVLAGIETYLKASARVIPRASALYRVNP